MLVRVTARQRLATYRDVQLVDLLTNDVAKAEEFVSDTQGPIATAEAELRETIATYIDQLFNASRTTEKFFTHRNTILRRLDRVDQLLPRPLTDNVTNVAAAIEIVPLRPMSP